MKILENLMSCPSILSISKEELKSLRPSQRQIDRLNRIPNKTNEDKEILKTAEIYDAWIKLSPPFSSIYDLLENLDLDILDEETQQKLVNDCAELFSSAFKFEANPLHLLPLLELVAASSPLLFSALLLSLTRQDISPNEIIQTGILYRYIMNCIDNIENVKKTYLLLSCIPNPSLSLTSLLKQADTLELQEERKGEIVTERSGRKTLSGRIITEDLPPAQRLEIPETAPFSFTATQENLDNLLQLFGNNFLLQALFSPSSEKIRSLLKQKISKMPDEIITNIVDMLRRNLTEPDRTNTLLNFFSYLSDVQMRSVLNKSPNYLWLGLSLKSNLLQNIDEKTLARLIENSSIDLFNVHHALWCMHQGLVVTFEETTLLKVLDCLMKHANTEIHEGIIDLFKINSRSKAFCKTRSDSLLSNFQADVENCVDLSRDSYISFEDNYRRKLYQWRLLEKLGGEILDYPHDKYEAQSYVMFFLFKKELLKPDSLDIFNHSTSSYDETVRMQAKIKTLLTCLVERDDEELQTWIIKVLAELGVTNWGSLLINTPSFFDKAIQHHNLSLLKRFYQEIPLEFRLEEITQKKIGENTILKRVLQYPQLLETILLLLPENERLKALIESQTNGITALRDTVGNRESMYVIFSHLPEEDRLTALKTRYRSGDTLLDLISKNSDLLGEILSLLNTSNRLTALREKNGNKIFSLVKASNKKRQLLETIFSRLSENDRLCALNEKPNNEEQSLLNEMLPFPNLMEVILSFLTQENIIAILNFKIAEEPVTFSLNFLKYLDVQQAHELLRSAPDFLWLMLLAKPELIEKLDKTMLSQLMDNHPITSLTSLSHALSCAQQQEFNFCRHKIYSQTLNYLIEQPETVNIPSDILKFFKKAPDSSASAEKMHQDLLIEFQNYIEANLPITQDSYKKIITEYEKKSYRWSLLEKLSGKTLHHSRSREELQSFILKTLFQKNELGLDCMHVFYIEKRPNETEQEFVIQSFTSCLVEQNNEDLHSWIISQLRDLGIPEWKNLQVHHSPILTQIIQHENTSLLKRYYQELPTEQRSQAFEEEDIDGNTILHRAVNYPLSLKTILSFLPENKAPKLSKNKAGDTLLHLVNNLESLKIILELYPTEKEKQRAIQEINLRRNNTLFLKANHPEILEVMLSLYPTIKEKMAAINQPDAMGHTLLRYALINPESLEIILAIYPTQNGKLDAINTQGLLFPATQHPKALKILLAHIHPDARLEIVKQPYSADKRSRDTILHLASQAPESLKIILEIYPKKERLTAILKKNSLYSGSRTPIRNASRNFESLKIILDALPEEHRIEAIQDQDYLRNTLLHYTANQPECLKMILEIYPEEQRLLAVKQKNSNGKTVLLNVTTSPESLRIILALYPKNERLHAITEPDRADETILNMAADHPEMIKAIFSLLPENDQLCALKKSAQHQKEYESEPEYQSSSQSDSDSDSDSEYDYESGAEHQSSSQSDSEYDQEYKDEDKSSSFGESKTITASEDIHENSKNTYTILDKISENTASCEALLSVLLENQKDLEFIRPLVKNQQSHLPLTDELSSNTFQRKLIAHYISENTKAFLYTYVTLKEMPQNSATLWLRALITGEILYQNDDYTSHHDLLCQGELNPEINKFLDGLRSILIESTSTKTESDQKSNLDTQFRPKP